MAQWDAERAERWMRDQAQRSEVYGTATEKMLELAEIRTADRVLDVAAGAGDQTLLAARLVGPSGYVLATDISSDMLSIAAEMVRGAGLTNVDTRVMDGENVDLDADSFDAVICLRVLMHTPDWRRSLGELCRVARDRVVFDYPALLSAAALQAAARHAVHATGGRVEAYRVFADRTVAAALGINGFRIADSHRQFVLPIAFHKGLNSAAATGRIEGALARAGLTRLFGSPVTLVAERCAS